MGMFKEFKEFAMRGNVVDLAVGIIIGGAFGKIVSSLVGDIVMPTVGALTGGTNFSDYYLWLGKGDKPATLTAAKASGQPFIGWGEFLQTTVDFVIVAFAIFLMVKAINTARAKLEEQPEKSEAPPPEDIKLLREIRDSLRKY
jgi:large conductance mechanosensitive channel